MPLKPSGAVRWMSICLLWHFPQKDTTSLLIVEIEESISNLAARAKQWIDESMDIVLIRTLGTSDARVIGAVEDQDLFTLMPYCRRA